MAFNPLDKSGFTFAVSTLWGKITNKFDSLAKVARSGSYIDLTNKPTIPDAVRVKGNAEITYRTGNVNLTPEDIGAASVGDLTSSWNKFNALSSVGWYRIGKVRRSNSSNRACVITIKKSYSNGTGEIHKCEFIQYYSGNMFKSIYDVCDNPSKMQFTKIRYVIDENNCYIDIYGANNYSNSVTVVFSDARATFGGIWEALIPTEIVPETTEGETVLAELEFEANSWLPDKADADNVWSLSGGTEIPANADLDDYKTIGNYYCSTNAIATSLENCPVETSFIMRVIYSGGIDGNRGQLISSYSTGKTYYRGLFFTTGNISPWYLLSENLINNLTTTEAGKGSLDAYQGYLLNKNTKSLTKFTEIPSGADLKSATYLVPGNYNFASSPVSKLTNCPVTDAFTLTVSYANGGNNYIKQTFETYDGAKKVVRTCNKNTGNWGSQYTYTGTST